MSKNGELQLEGSLKQAYVRALRLRLAQAKQRDLKALWSTSCPVCKEVLRIVLKEGLTETNCDLYPIDYTCHLFMAKRYALRKNALSMLTKDADVVWAGFVIWLSGLLEEALQK